MEISKAATECRTLNDFVELNNKVIQHSCESFFDQCSRMTNLAFECAQEIAEPINQTLSESTERLSKIVTQS